jgi:hypothetical protein
MANTETVWALIRDPWDAQTALRKHLGKQPCPGS